MKHPSEAFTSGGRTEGLPLADAYAGLQQLILAAPAVTEFLHQLAVLTAAIVPGSHCGVTLIRDDQGLSVAGTDDVALELDEVQHVHGAGPCLEAMLTSHRVDVPDLTVEDRWGTYSAHAVADGVRSVVALPLVFDGATIGALNLFGTSIRAFSEPDVARAEAFADQAAMALTIALRQASRISLDEQLREALATRALIDQALGILMHSQQISAEDAFEVLRSTSQNSNVKVSVLATMIIAGMTGHAPTPPRPLGDRS